jgi:hypothetical protein
MPTVQRHHPFIHGPPTLQAKDNPVHISDVDIDIDMCDIVQTGAPREGLSSGHLVPSDGQLLELSQSFPSQCTQGV